MRNEEEIWGWGNNEFDNMEGYLKKMSRGQSENKKITKSKFSLSSMRWILESRKYFRYLNILTYVLH